MKHVLSIPLFRADRISEAQEAEILAELRFAGVCIDSHFRDSNTLHVGCIIEAEDRYEAYALACEQMELALEEVDRADILEAA